MFYSPDFRVVVKNMTQKLYLNIEVFLQNLLGYPFIKPYLNILFLFPQRCIGKQRCTVTISNGNFGDPCPNILKRLSVEAVCTPTTTRAFGGVN